MAKPAEIELPDGTLMRILYEDRGVMAVDKPAGWMLGPEDEERLSRNLHVALVDLIGSGAWWARSRNLRFLRFVHRLDAPTTGVLLMAKSQGAIPPFSRLFATRDVSKRYLAVTEGVPREQAWTCREPLGPDPELHGRHRVDRREGKPAETDFRVLEVRGNRALVEARPITGRTHQIRLHLRAAGCQVVGDVLYGRSDPVGLALRAVEMSYKDPFTGKPVRIRADESGFKARLGFGPVPATAPSAPGEAPAAAPDVAPAPPPAFRSPAGRNPARPPRPGGPGNRRPPVARGAGGGGGDRRRPTTPRRGDARPSRPGPRGR